MSLNVTLAENHFGCQIKLYYFRNRYYQAISIFLIFIFFNFHYSVVVNFTRSLTFVKCLGLSKGYVCYTNLSLLLLNIVNLSLVNTVIYVKYLGLNSFQVCWSELCGWG